jgi:hypothetical protein
MDAARWYRMPVTISHARSEWRPGDLLSYGA